MARVEFLSGVALAAMTLTAPLAAQRLEVAIAAGVSKPLAEISPTRPGAGVSVEIQPQLQFRSGFGLGLGFRHTAYAGVPDRGSLYADVRYTGRRGPVRPVVGLRAGGFVGGDEGGDDAYLGLEIGPIAGIDVPRGRRASFQALGSAYTVLALYRGVRLMPGLQVGLVLR